MTAPRKCLFACLSLLAIYPVRIPSQATTKITAPRPNGSPQSAEQSDPAAKKGPFRPGKDGVGYPSCSYCPSPAYTPEARKAKFEGVVLLQVIIQTNGRATDIQVVRSLPYGLEGNAIKAVLKWRFKPARGPDGKPVAVVTAVEVTFRLPRN
jgi:TonB family protein